MFGFGGDATTFWNIQNTKLWKVDWRKRQNLSKKNFAFNDGNSKDFSWQTSKWERKRWTFVKSQYRKRRKILTLVCGWNWKIDKKLDQISPTSCMTLDHQEEQRSGQVYTVHAHTHTKRRNSICYQNRRWKHGKRWTSQSVCARSLLSQKHVDT